MKTHTRKCTLPASHGLQRAPCNRQCERRPPCGEVVVVVVSPDARTAEALFIVPLDRGNGAVHTYVQSYTSQRIQCMLHLANAFEGLVKVEYPIRAERERLFTVVKEMGRCTRRVASLQDTQLPCI